MKRENGKQPKKNTAAKSVSKNTGKKTLAERADKFRCYQQAVQEPEHEVEFFDQVYRQLFRRSPYSLREDFCGTFSICCNWVQSHPKRTAVGVDLCPETLQWGKEHNLAKLTEEQTGRIRLLERDVRTQNRPQVDILTAQNFSFWIFKTRQELVEYFRIARANLNKQGMLVMDMMGGGDCYQEGVTDKRLIRKGKKGFRYHWEQACFNPVTSEASFYITFKFNDQSKLKRAFEYHWRFWTIPEVRELLQEAGFTKSFVYWEEEDEDGEDTDVWSAAEIAPSHPSWIAYIVALK
jgi:hypothetical protein